MRLQDRVAVITGAASGMGRAMALRFAAEGARVAAAEVAAEGLRDVVSAIEAQGGQAGAIVADVPAPDDVEQMIDLAVDAFGTVDILVNNAGIMDAMSAAHEVTVRYGNG